MTKLKKWDVSSAIPMWNFMENLLRKMTYNFLVPKNKIARRQVDILG